MNPTILDINLGNCTNIIQMEQIDRVSYFATQKPILLTFIAGWMLLAFVMFIYGLIVSIGNSRKMLLIHPNFFIFFIFWIIIGGITIFMLYKPLWILPFL